MSALKIKIRYKIMMVVGIAVTAGLLAIGVFYTQHQETSVLAQNERTMHKLTESVIQGLQSVMLAGSADIAQSFAERLKKIPEIADFRIMRVDGNEAFRDNSTIEAVNKRRGEDAFTIRDKETQVSILRADDANLRRVLAEGKPISVYETEPNGARNLNFYAPIENHELCYKCHGAAESVRGVIKLTTSLIPVERDILKVRQQSLIVIAIALMAIMLSTGYMMGRAVVHPIELVARAIARVSDGDLDHKVPIQGRDELARMAKSFNQMTSELKATYDGLRKEQDKLTTIIRGAGEGMVVTDSEGMVVLVNPAAEALLGKRAEVIIAQGFDDLFEDPASMRRWMSETDEPGPAVIEYNKHVLQVFATTIKGADGKIIGSAALLRDVTEEQRLELELRKLSTTDGLTGLFNRRFLDESILTEFHRALRTHTPLSVIMIDIDQFRNFNREYGHDQGDRMLKSVAGTLRAALRKYDFPCRYGGDELLAILPNTTSEGAYAVAERLRQDIEQTLVHGMQATASLGVATFPSPLIETPGQLIELADQALFEAKSGGHNRTVVAASESPPTDHA